MKTCDRALAICSVSVFLALLSSVAAADASILPTSDSHDQHESTGESQGVVVALSPKHLQSRFLTRHIRSTDQHEPQPSQQQSDLEQDDNIQSTSNFLAPKGTVLHRWLYRGTGQPQFPRGLRRDSHFIRFGRNANFDFDEFTPTVNNNGNKKNNFIRLGRENPRRNNFIRLGRSGAGSGPWGNNERLTKVGYFPDYYSQLLGGGNNLLDFVDQHQPLPYDSDFAPQG